MVQAYAGQFEVSTDEARRRLVVQQRATRVDDELAARIASRYGEIAFLNDRGLLRVAITDPSAVDAVVKAASDAGLNPSDYEIAQVQQSIASLSSAQQDVDDAVRDVITEGFASTQIDTITNDVVINLAQDAQAAAAAKVDQAAAATGAEVSPQPAGSREPVLSGVLNLRR